MFILSDKKKKLEDLLKDPYGNAPPFVLARSIISGLTLSYPSSFLTPSARSLNLQ